PFLRNCIVSSERDCADQDKNRFLHIGVNWVRVFTRRGARAWRQSAWRGSFVTVGRDIALRCPPVRQCRPYLREQGRSMSENAPLQYELSKRFDARRTGIEKQRRR